MELIKPILPNFKASNKWLQRLKTRNSLKISACYTTVWKKKIIEESKNHGMKHTAKKHNLNVSTIYKWYKQDFTVPNVGEMRSPLEQESNAKNHD